VRVSVDREAADIAHSFRSGPQRKLQCKFIGLQFVQFADCEELFGWRKGSTCAGSDDQLYQPWEGVNKPDQDWLPGLVSSAAAAYDEILQPVAIPRVQLHRQRPHVRGCTAEWLPAVRCAHCWDCCVFDDRMMRVGRLMSVLLPRKPLALLL
jgi:hypothetical protein